MPASLRKKVYAGIAQLARASAFQAEGCEFESNYPLHFKIKLLGCIAQLVRAHDW